MGAERPTSRRESNASSPGKRAPAQTQRQLEHLREEIDVQDPTSLLARLWRSVYDRQQEIAGDKVDNMSEHLSRNRVWTEFYGRLREYLDNQHGAQIPGNNISVNYRKEYFRLVFNSLQGLLHNRFFGNPDDMERTRDHGQDITPFQRTEIDRELHKIFVQRENPGPGRFYEWVAARGTGEGESIRQSNEHIRKFDIIKARLSRRLQPNDTEYQNFQGYDAIMHGLRGNLLDPAELNLAANKITELYMRFLFRKTMERLIGVEEYAFTPDHLREIQRMRNEAERINNHTASWDYEALERLERDSSNLMDQERWQRSHPNAPAEESPAERRRIAMEYAGVTHPLDPPTARQNPDRPREEREILLPNEMIDPARKQEIIQHLNQVVDVTYRSKNPRSWDQVERNALGPIVNRIAEFYYYKGLLNNWTQMETGTYLQRHITRMYDQASNENLPSEGLNFFRNAYEYLFTGTPEAHTDRVNTFLHGRELDRSKANELRQFLATFRERFQNDFLSEIPADHYINDQSINLTRAIPLIPNIRVTLPWSEDTPAEYLRAKTLPFDEELLAMGIACMGVEQDANVALHDVITTNRLGTSGARGRLAQWWYDYLIQEYSRTLKPNARTEIPLVPNALIPDRVARYLDSTPRADFEQRARAGSRAMIREWTNHLVGNIVFTDQSWVPGWTATRARP